jgi:hypothetical protein
LPAAAKAVLVDFWRRKQRTGRRPTAARAEGSVSSATDSDSFGLQGKLRGFARISLLAALIALGLGGLAQYSLAKGRVRFAMIGYGVAAILFVTALRQFMPNDFAGPCTSGPSPRRPPAHDLAGEIAPETRR